MLNVTNLPTLKTSDLCRCLCEQHCCFHFSAPSLPNLPPCPQQPNHIVCHVILWLACVVPFSTIRKVFFVSLQCSPLCSFLYVLPSVFSSSSLHVCLPLSVLFPSCFLFCVSFPHQCVCVFKLWFPMYSLSVCCWCLCDVSLELLVSPVCFFWYVLHLDFWCFLCLIQTLPFWFALCSAVWFATLFFGPWIHFNLCSLVTVDSALGWIKLTFFSPLSCVLFWSAFGSTFSFPQTDDSGQSQCV